MRAENLEKISFSSNNIGAEGCLAISRANWPQISVIDLSNNTITKAEIKLKMKIAIIWQRQVGICCKLI
jgi:hypothetical protein